LLWVLALGGGEQVRVYAQDDLGTLSIPQFRKAGQSITVMLLGPRFLFPFFGFIFIVFIFVVWYIHLDDFLARYRPVEMFRNVCVVATPRSRPGAFVPHRAQMK
jgi:hypothetical protein